MIVFSPTICNTPKEQKCHVEIKKKILDYVLPLPPLSEQRRIVEILDRFDTLTNSISEGLPREIALRRKQYEYYRDALLNFPPRPKGRPSQLRAKRAQSGESM